MTPYIDIEVTDKYIIREFNENIDPIELLWHRDNEDRTIEIIEDTDWQLQQDNELPVEMIKGNIIYIDALKWHRVIKGNTILKIKIKEY